MRPYAAIALIIPAIEACGVAVHSTLVERIKPLLPPRIQVHDGYLRAGAFYPDAFYDCMGQSEAAEEAHWPPFLKHGVDMVTEKRALHEDTSQLEAFLVGILTHQVADVSWHSLGIYQGLLRAMADSEFDGDYDKAHTVLDVGGDMILMHRTKNKDAIVQKWDFKAADVQELLRRAGYPGIAQSSINYCMARGQAALSAENRVADVAYKRFTRRSPLLFDQLESYYAGGLTDMHEQIEECLPTLLGWISPSGNAPISDPWNICQVFDGKRPLNDEDPESGLERRDGHMHKLHHSYANFIEVIRDTKKAIKNKVSVKKVPPTLDTRIFSAPPNPLPVTVASVSRPGFGEAALFWEDLLVVSAPGEGVVYFYEKVGDLNSTIRLEAEDAKPRGKYATQFGKAIEIWAGFLVVSSPGTGRLDLYDRNGTGIYRKGCIVWDDVETVYGRRGAKLLGERLVVDKDFLTLYVGSPHYDDGVSDQTGIVHALPEALLRQAIKKDTCLLLPLNKDVLSKGTEPYANVGASIAVTPRFILVGAPGESRVYGFDFATKKRILTLEGPQTSSGKPSGYGGHLLAGDRDYVLIGAPAASTEDSDEDDQQGVLYMYKNNRLHQISSDEEFDWLGSTGILVKDSSGDDVLIIASPHASDGAGTLWKVNPRENSIEKLGAPRGSQFSSLGTSLATNGTAIAVGMPNYNSGTQRLGAVALVEV